MKKFTKEEYEETREYGGIVKIYISRKTDSELKAGIIELQPGESLVKDIHDNDEIYYVIEGTIKVESPEGALVNAERGEIVLIPAREVHFASNPGNKVTRIFCCLIDPEN